jgi:hypothetical protein
MGNIFARYCQIAQTLDFGWQRFQRAMNAYRGWALKAPPRHRAIVEERPFRAAYAWPLPRASAPGADHGTASLASSDRALSFPRTSTADTE